MGVWFNIVLFLENWEAFFWQAAFCHSYTMDRSEWIPHTTKTGKILYYINPVTGECKWQSQLNKVCKCYSAGLITEGLMMLALNILNQT